MFSAVADNPLAVYIRVEPFKYHVRNVIDRNSIADTTKNDSEVIDQQRF